MLCLGLDSEAAANRLLVVAGVADLVVVALMFVPGWPRLLALLYMVIWGLLTAMARPWAYFEPTAAAESLDLWLPQALYRVAHFAIPFCLLVALRPRKAETDPPTP